MNDDRQIIVISIYIFPNLFSESIIYGLICQGDIYEKTKTSAYGLVNDYKIESTIEYNALAVNTEIPESVFGF